MIPPQPVPIEATAISEAHRVVETREGLVAAANQASRISSHHVDIIRVVLFKSCSYFSSSFTYPCSNCSYRPSSRSNRPSSNLLLLGQPALRRLATSFFILSARVSGYRRAALGLWHSREKVEPGPLIRGLEGVGTERGSSETLPSVQYGVFQENSPAA